MIKQLLAGAAAVQVASCLYKHGTEYIREMHDTLKAWMKARHFNSLSDFRGKMSQAKASDPAAYERVQFMKYFS